MLSSINFKSTSVIIEESMSEDIYSGRSMADKKYLVKRLPVERLNRELQIYSQLGSHPNILRLHDSLVQGQDGYMLLDNCECTLRTLLDKGLIPEDRACAFFKEILQGLEFLHKNGLVHSGLSPESVYITSDGQAKIGDFWNAGPPGSSCGAPHSPYKAPEQESTISADLWALGCVLFELLFRELPQGNLLGLRLPTGSLISRIVPRILKEAPSERPTIQEIQQLLSESEPPSPSLLSQLTNRYKQRTRYWVKIATSESESIPDPLGVSKLIEKAWKKPFKVPKFYRVLLQRLSNKPAINLKCLAVIHRYLIGGPKAVFIPNVHPIFQKYQRGFKYPTKKLTEHTEQIINGYSALLCKKASLHEETGSFGNWHLCENQKQIPAILGFWGDCISLARIVLSDLQSELNGCVASLLIEQQRRLHTQVSAQIQDSVRLQEKLRGLRSNIRDFRQKFPHLHVEDPPDLQPVSSDPTADTVNTTSESSFIDKSWIIDYEDLQIGQILGVGNSCVVYTGEFKFTPAAIKVMRAGHNSVKKEFERELQIFTSIRHPNLVLFLGACMLPELCLVTEICQGGTLFELLHERLDIRLTWRMRLRLALDVAQGMAYLHSCLPPIIHRDLKTLNLLLLSPVSQESDFISVKITDFGVSKIFSAGDEHLMTGQMGTCHWMAPEVLESKPYSLAADVYSFGVVLWEIAARQTPYKQISPPLIPYHVVQLGRRPDMTALDGDCPSEYRALIDKCLLKEPAERPDFGSILMDLSQLMGTLH